MVFKVITALLALALLAMYFAPVVLKLREPSLAVVVLVGLGFAAYDTWKSVSNDG